MGIIPAYIRIIVSDNNMHYYLETEVNFRILYKKQMVLCFDDMFLDGKHNEFTIRKFRSQKDTEKSLFDFNLKFVRKMVLKKTTKIR